VAPDYHCAPVDWIVPVDAIAGLHTFWLFCRSSPATPITHLLPSSPHILPGHTLIHCSCTLLYLYLQLHYTLVTFLFSPTLALMPYFHACSPLPACTYFVLHYLPRVPLSLSSSRFAHAHLHAASRAFVQILVCYHCVCAHTVRTVRYYVRHLRLTGRTVLLRYLTAHAPARTSRARYLHAVGLLHPHGLFVLPRARTTTFHRTWTHRAHSRYALPHLRIPLLRSYLCWALATLHTSLFHSRGRARFCAVLHHSALPACTHATLLRAFVTHTRCT